MSTLKTFKYLVYDIESITNKPLLKKVLYPNEAITDDEAYKRHMAELAEDNQQFVNAAFHKPVSLAAVAVKDDFSISRIGLLGGDKRTTASIVTAFWDVYNKNKPILVDYNGKGYDIRLMELWAFQMGITIDTRHFKQFGPRYRFSADHIDLQEFLNNYAAVRWKGGLDLFAKLLGKPGKMETKGHMVQELFEKGEMFQIDDYCLCDAMDTYFVFLRTRVMTGELTLDREHELVTDAGKLLEEKREKEGFFKPYLENFGKWMPER